MRKKQIHDSVVDSECLNIVILMEVNNLEKIAADDLLSSKGLLK